MADLDWPGDPPLGCATHKAPTTITNDTSAPRGSLILSSDSDPLLEQKKSPSGLVPAKTALSGPLSLFLPHSPLSEPGEAKGGLPSPTSPPLSPILLKGKKAPPQNSPKSPLTPSRLLVSEINRNLLPPSPSVASSPPDSPPLSPLLTPTQDFPSEDKNPPNFADEYRLYKKGIILYTEKASRQGKLHALVGCPDEPEDNFFFRIPLEEFSPLPRPATLISFSYLPFGCSGPVGFRKKYPCRTGSDPSFLNEDPSASISLKGHCADNPTNAKKFFFTWAPIFSDPSFTIKYSFFLSELPKKFFFGVEADTSITLRNKKRATGMHPSILSGAYHGDISIPHTPHIPIPVEPLDSVPPPSLPQRTLLGPPL